MAGRSWGGHSGDSPLPRKASQGLRPQGLGGPSSARHGQGTGPLSPAAPTPVPRRQGCRRGGGCWTAAARAPPGRGLPRLLRGQQLQRPGFGTDAQAAESAGDGHPRALGPAGQVTPQPGRQPADAGWRGPWAHARGSGGLHTGAGCSPGASCRLLTFGPFPPHWPPARPRTARSWCPRTLTLTLTLETAFPTHPSSLHPHPTATPAAARHTRPWPGLPTPDPLPARGP